MGRFHLLFLFFAALMFAVSLNSLFFYHCYLVLHNRSTLGKKKEYIYTYALKVMYYTKEIVVNFYLHWLVEAFRPPMFLAGKDKDGFSLGKYNNFQEVFGDNARLWFLPIFTRWVYICFIYLWFISMNMITYIINNSIKCYFKN